MNSVSMNENPISTNKYDDSSIKILAMNCAGLKSHFDDVRHDHKLKKSDAMLLLETSLSQDENKKEL